MDFDNEESPCRVPNDTPSGNFKAVASVRIPQACDRCRIKKAKCDGGNPCGRCHITDSLCVFGEKIKAGRTVYPKGYVEMLERQQTQLVAGLQALYRKLTGGEPWDGERLPEYDNRSRTQDILAALGLVQPPKHAASQVEGFGEHFPSLCFDEIDNNNDQNVVPDFSNAENRLPTTYDHPIPVSIDAWDPSLEVELADLLESGKHDWNQEKEAGFLQFLETTLPKTVPPPPDMVSQEISSTHCSIDRNGCWASTSVSVSPLTWPANLQSFEFNVDPTTLRKKGAYSRRRQAM